MEKILAMLGEIKGLFSAKASTDQALIESLATVKDLQSKIAEQGKAIEAHAATVADMNKQIATAKAEKQTAEKDAAAKVEAENKRTDDVLAAVGADPKTIPAAPATPKSPGASTKAGSKILDEYAAITDSTANVIFFNKHKEEIRAAIREQSNQS